VTTLSAYHHGDLRQAALQKAGEILEKEGLESLSLREVARRAGVSHNAPYRHFSDHDRLLVALVEEGFEMLIDALARRPRREMGEAYVDFAFAHPQRFRLMFGGRVKLAKPDRRTYEGLKQSFADLGEDAKYAAAAAWGLVHGFSHLLLDGHFATEERKSFVRSVLGAVRFSAPRRG
jgi:AcrR family transcriptional regulator